MRIRLSQRRSSSGETTDSNRIGRLRRSCNNVINYATDETPITPQNDEEEKEQEHEESYQIPLDTEVSQPPGAAGSCSTSSGVEIPNAQPEKYVLPPQTATSNPETEDTYVDYRVTSVQGGGDNPKKSSEGTYSLVANTLKLSTV